MDAENEKITWMSRRVAAWLAWSLSAVSLALYALALLLIFLGRSAPTQEGYTAWQGEAVFLLGFLGMPILGGLIASRRPDNPYGWLWCGVGFGFALVTSLDYYIVYTVAVDPGSLPAPGMALWLWGMAWVVSITLVPFLFLLFPDGRLPSRRWRPVAWTAAAGAVLLLLGPFRPGRGAYGSVEVENPLGIGGAIGEVIVVLTDTGVNVVFAAIALSALSLVFRFRRASGVERQQIKWFASAAVLVGGLTLSDFLGFQVLALWDRILETVSFAGLYVAVAVAILRHRLYDIDVIINRTLVYGTLTAMLALIYFGGVALLQAAFRVLTGQEQQPQLVVVASTLAIAALFNPLRRRIQDVVDRRFYRRKYDAAKTLQAFTARLRDEMYLDALSDDLTSVVRETMRPEHVSLWLREPADQVQTRSYRGADG